MLKELIQSLKPEEHLPKAFEKCKLCPINRQKVLDRLPSIVESQEIARHIDSALLKKLEVRRIWRGQQKKPRGQKVPAGQSYTEAAGDSEDTNEEEADDVENEDDEEDELEQEDDVEEEGADNCLTWMSLALPAKAAATMLLLFMKASGSWRRSVVTRRTWAEATPTSAIW